MCVLTFTQYFVTLVGIIGEFSRATFENNAKNADPVHSDPKIVLSYEEASQFENSCTNVMVQLCNGEKYALLNSQTGASNPHYQKGDAFRHEVFERGYSPAGIGRRRGIQMIQMLKRSMKTNLLRRY